MKDEDLELVLDSIKEIDNKLSYVIKKLNDMDELYFNLYQKHYPIIDNEPLFLGQDFRDLEPTTHNIKRMNEAVERSYQNDLKDKKPEPYTVKQVIEEGFELDKEIDHTEYLRCLDEGEDTTWYIDKWIKGTPGLDDQDEVAQSEEDEETKYLHYRDNE